MLLSVHTMPAATLLSLCFIARLAHSTTLQCNSAVNPQCGPCAGTDTCNLKCNLLEEVCLESIFQCQADQACIIDCSATKACDSSMVRSTSDLTMNCNAIESCVKNGVFVTSGADVVINCGADSSCLELQLDASEARDVTVTCDGQESCKGMLVKCGTGKCAVQCNDARSSVCGSLELRCLSASQCSIDCTMSPLRRNPKCPSILVSYNTLTTQKFECVGSAQDCEAAPAPFVIPTMSPTALPTSSPSRTPSSAPSTPTRTPTTIPTSSPSSSPTIVPSPSPSKTPTRSPSKTPSRAPSKTPSKTP